MERNVHVLICSYSDSIEKDVYVFGSLQEAMYRFYELVTRYKHNKFKGLFSQSPHDFCVYKSFEVITAPLIQGIGDWKTCNEVKRLDKYKM